MGYVSDQRTPAAIAGLQVGDVITAIDGAAVHDMLDYFKALNNLSYRTVTFTVEREGTTVTLGLSR